MGAESLAGFRGRALNTTGADPGFTKGADHGERVEHKPITWGIGAESLAGFRGRAPGGGPPLKLKAFIQKWPKV